MSASKRARTVLELFGSRPAPWRLEYIEFRRRSFMQLDGIRWHVQRSLAVTDIGISSGISMAPVGNLDARLRARLTRAAWPQLRESVARAGFEDHSELRRGFTHAFFLRPVATDEALDEWAFLQKLRLRHALAGRGLPERSMARVAHMGRPRDEGLCARVFSKLRRHHALMTNLESVGFVYEDFERYADERWRVTRRVRGDSHMLQVIVQFWPESARGLGPERAPKTLTPIRRALLSRGYQPGGHWSAFGKWPLGHVSVAEERKYLDAFRLPAGVASLH